MSLPPPAIRALTPADWPFVARIYAEGIATGCATFETEVPDWATWDAAHHPAPRLLSEQGNRILGWAALGPVSRRACYAGVAEVSIYLASEARGRGLGRPLLEALLAAADRAGLWTVQAGIFAENVASLRLHQRCGFRVVGRRERIAQLGGRWHDTVLLERRRPDNPSPVPERD
jgi:phosphinothricin acetyltransferase